MSMLNVACLVCLAYRKRFLPPSKSLPLVVRSVSYGGEEHPVDQKRTIVVPVARLPLKDAAAVHRFKVFAGPRWSTEAPRDSGFDLSEGDDEHGYFKISCEDFPKAAMNLKWASDTLDRLIVAANVSLLQPVLHKSVLNLHSLQDSSHKWVKDVPVDVRHIEARVRKAKKGDHVYGRGGHRPSIKDFPQEWLPASVSKDSGSSPVIA